MLRIPNDSYYFSIWSDPFFLDNWHHTTGQRQNRLQYRNCIFAENNKNEVNDELFSQYHSAFPSFFIFSKHCFFNHNYIMHIMQGFNPYSLLHIFNYMPCLFFNSRDGAKKVFCKWSRCVIWPIGARITKFPAPSFSAGVTRRLRTCEVFGRVEISPKFLS